MSFRDWLKKPKREFSRVELQQQMEKAIIPDHARSHTAVIALTGPVKKPQQKPQRRPVIVIPSEKNVFFVESSFKLPPTFILNGYARSGEIKRNMRTTLNNETIMINSIQSAFKQVGKLGEGQKGSLEITTNIGLDVPDLSELEFSFKTKKPKRKKRKKAKTKKSRKTPKTIPVPKPIETPIIEPALDIEGIVKDLAPEDKNEPTRPTP
ncbi:hypothetical protein KKE06_00600 [Candidatus Micrarchaeota archaeon]|nr:hypothetical protein [Candidatus Micrarchaeota archaeon]MBU1930303.1 hypothetical protein [Candidatus Micrarchaeota archaeon]